MVSYFPCGTLSSMQGGHGFASVGSMYLLINSSPFWPSVYKKNISGIKMVWNTSLKNLVNKILLYHSLFKVICHLTFRHCPPSIHLSSHYSEKTDELMGDSKFSGKWHKVRKGKLPGDLLKFIPVREISPLSSPLHCIWKENEFSRFNLKSNSSV